MHVGHDAWALLVAPQDMESHQLDWLLLQPDHPEGELIWISALHRGHALLLSQSSSPPLVLTPCLILPNMQTRQRLTIRQREQFLLVNPTVFGFDIAYCTIMLVMFAV